LPRPGHVYPVRPCGPYGVDQTASLIERGVADYPLEQCRGDYKMALLPATRLASAVGFHPGLTATPDGSGTSCSPVTPEHKSIWV
jgi:hypothetical protein